MNAQVSFRRKAQARGIKALAPLAATGMLLASAPGAAEPREGDEQRVERLGACVASGAAGAPRDSLLSAVVAIRSLCSPQIKRVREDRLRQVDESFGLPEATLSPRRQEELERARDAATRHLNDEIALTISNLTGLTL